MEEFDGDKHMIFYGFFMLFPWVFLMFVFVVSMMFYAVLMWFYMWFCMCCYMRFLYMRFSVHLGPFFLKISSVLLGSSDFLDGKFTSLMKYLERSARHGRSSGIEWKSAQMPTICQHGHHGREAAPQNAQ